MLKIRRPLGRLIFNMGIAIPGKTVFLIETAPWLPTPICCVKLSICDHIKAVLKCVFHPLGYSRTREFFFAICILQHRRLRRGKNAIAYYSHTHTYIYMACLPNTLGVLPIYPLVMWCDVMYNRMSMHFLACWKYCTFLDIVSLSTPIPATLTIKTFMDWKVHGPTWGVRVSNFVFTCIRHPMETFSALLAIYKGQWRGALMFSLICVWINSCVNNRKAGDLRRYRIHYDVTVMTIMKPHLIGIKWV